MARKGHSEQLTWATQYASRMAGPGKLELSSLSIQAFPAEVRKQLPSIQFGILRRTRPTYGKYMRVARRTAAVGRHLLRTLAPLRPQRTQVLTQTEMDTRTSKNGSTRFLATT